MMSLGRPTKTRVASPSETVTLDLVREVQMSRFKLQIKTPVLVSNLAFGFCHSFGTGILNFEIFAGGEPWP
jgi:hypothetical protein